MKEDAFFLRFFRKHLLVTSCLFNLLLFFVFFCCFVPGYETNDDLTMDMLVQGVGFSDTGVANLLWSQLWIGKMLKLAYQLIPDVSWYPVYQVSLHFVSCVLLLYLLLKRQFGLVAFVLFFVYFFSIELYMLSNLQYTTCSFTIGLPGVFLSYEMLLSKPTRRKIFLVFGCFFLSFGVRPESFYLLMLLSIPLYASILIKHFSKHALRKYIMFFLGVVVMVLIAKGSQYYLLGTESGDWQRHERKIQLISGLVNNYTVNSPELANKTLRSVGWSENDLYMIKHWYYCDTTVFSNEKIKSFNKQLPSSEKRKSNAYLGHYLYYALTHREFMIIAGVFLIWLSLALVEKRSSIVLFLCSGLVTVFIAIALILYVRFPDRVLLCMFGFLLYLLVFLFIPLKRFAETPLGLPLGIFRIALLVFTCWCCWVLFCEHRQGSKVRVQRNLQLKAFLKLHPIDQKELLVIMGGEGFLYGDLLPFDHLREYVSNKLWWISSFIESPPAEQRSKEFAITNLSLDLVRLPNLVVASTEELNMHYRTFMQEHYGMKVSFMPRAVFQRSGVGIYKVVEEKTK